MKRIFFLAFAITLLAGCDKNDKDRNGCDIGEARERNAAKRTITNGIWGTVSRMEGNCMPVMDVSQCIHCPAQRVVEVYAYTMPNQATPSDQSNVFFDSFSTQLIAETTADADGFYEVQLPAGIYTVVIVENGKLYASGRDGQGGLNPVPVGNGALQADLTLTYKAAF